MKQFLGAIVLVFILGCSNYQDNIKNETDNFESYLKKARIEIVGDSYIYDGCVEMSEEQVLRGYDDYISTDSRGNFDNPYMKWNNSERYNLTYQILGKLQTVDLTEDQVRNAFREATRKWMAVAGVKFIEVDENPLFTVEGEFNGENYSAKSFFPHYYTDGEGKLVIRLNRGYASMSYYTYDRMVGLFTHELGHALGLAHEHQRSDSPYNYGQGTYGYFHYGSYDSDSVMNYANRPYLNGISQGDIEAINYLYPQKYIIAYEDADYKGRSMKIDEYGGHGWLARVSWGGKISSIKCFNGAVVNLHSAYRFGGDKVTISRNVRNLDYYDFNDRTQSVSFSKTNYMYIVAYEEPNFTGRSIKVSSDLWELPLDNSISSIKIYNGLSARLYDGRYYSGDSKFIGIASRYAYQYKGYDELTWSASDLGNFNDKTTSIMLY